jgi:hypothetical protein
MTDTADTLEQNPGNPDDPESGANASVNTDAAAGDAANGTQTAALENGNDGAPNEGEGDDEVEFTFGDEAPPASTSQVDEAAPQWVKDLRKDFAASQRRNRELEAQLQQRQPQAPAVPTLGAKPTLAEFDYDEGKFEEALSKWHDDKRKVDAAQEEQREAGAARQREIDGYHTSYVQEAQSLKRKDFKDVEDTVIGALSVDQQGLIKFLDTPAAFVYALGHYPAKLKTLAAITNPVKFVIAAAKLEKDMKVSSRTTNAKAAPEGRVSSSSGAPAAGGGEKKLEQLRAEAERTGDYSKVHAYKRQLNKAQARK